MHSRPPTNGVDAATLRRYLLQAITEDRIPAGSRLPTEKTLMRQFAVPRSVVRKVFFELEFTGLVDRQQGRGTFRTARWPQRRTGLVGMWFNWPEGPLFSQIALGARRELSRWGYHCVIETGGLDWGAERRGIEALLRKELDGFLVAPSSNPRDDHGVLVGLRGRGLPLVLVDRALPGHATDLVTTHGELGTGQMVAHLIQLGHRRIGFVGVEGPTTVQDRLHGYREAMARHGLAVHEAWVHMSRRLAGASPINVDQGRLMVDSGGTCIDGSHCRDGIGRILRLPSDLRPTAFFGANDTIAGLVSEVARHFGFRIPQDLSVAGFDDLHGGSEARPAGGTALQDSITSYKQPSYLIGQQAARLLVERIQGRREQVTTVLLVGQLIERGSTAPPAQT